MTIFLIGRFAMPIDDDDATDDDNSHDDCHLTTTKISFVEKRDLVSD